MRNDTPRLRLGVLGVVAVSLFAALFARLWYLQVLASPEFQLQATALQQRVIIEPAPRGRILDREGAVLVDNRLSYVVSLDRDRLGDLDDAARTDLLQRLVSELQPVEAGVTVELLEERMRSSQYSPYVPVPVVDDVPQELAFRLIERETDYEGVVEVETRAIRTYPYGRLASHIVGYVGPINEDELAAMEEERPGEYQLTDEIGKAGVERTMESVLRGTPGRQIIEVDARGRFVRELPGSTEPVAGHDVVLSIDARVQGVAEQALREELARARERSVEPPNPPNASPAGSFVMLDTQDGSVVAMASYPDFDPAALTDGIDVAEWQALNSEGSFYPLNNRAIAGQYAPGSTFKVVTAYGGLRSGLITPEHTINDRGFYEIPNCRGDCTRNNAGREAHGQVNLRRSLSVSSDVYYYDIGARSWFARDQVGDPIQDAATTFGMGVRTGVELPGELRGRVMTPEEFAQRYEERPDLFARGVWQAGDSVNLAIGQGEMLVTPIQLANAYAAIANGGTVWRPSLVQEVRRAGTDEVVRSYDPEARATIEFQPGWREAIVDGLRGVTTEGTAAGTFSGFPNWAVAGKTGTAQVSGKADTAVFAAFAPADAPRYAAAAFLEESGFGGVAAAPLVRRVLEPLATGAIPGLEQGGEFGYTVVLPEAADPFAEGDVTD